MVQDIVCGMRIEEDDPTVLVKTFLGRTLSFCSAECLVTFSKNPVPFLAKSFEAGETAIDFVCGMDIEKTNLTYSLKYKGMTFYFCSYACKEHFEHNPQEFIGS